MFREQIMEQQRSILSFIMKPVTKYPNIHLMTNPMLRYKLRYNHPANSAFISIILLMIIIPVYNAGAIEWALGIGFFGMCRALLCWQNYQELKAESDRRKKISNGQFAVGAPIAVHTTTDDHFCSKCGQALRKHATPS